MQSTLDYRPDLDGLRAVAVLPVILFHLGFPHTPGGFVGVDVFFVLSGYLITRQIAIELSEGRFSLLDFYDRRMRRLLPALFAMLIGSTTLALIVLLPRDLDDFGESLVAAVFSISNFYFWTASGYFAPAAETMPLLHTWSLAVEEQFYLLFPPLMLLLWRIRSANAWRTLAILALISFVASIWATRAAPEAGFYLLPMRAWELLLGSLLALAPNFTPASLRQRNAAAGFGLLAIGAAIVAFDTSTPFPGMAAALPCLGAALVIWSGQPSPLAGVNADVEPSPLVLRLLSLPPLVFIGLISYSLYLWHWPLIVLGGQWTTTLSSPTSTALIVGATFAIASASWRFIEQPLRRGTSLWTTRGLRVRSSGVLVALLALVGLTLDIGDGFPWLQPKSVLAVVDDARDRSPLRERCHFEQSEQGRRGFAETCAFGDASGRKIVVLGDSHGAELSYALSQVAQERHFHVRQITASGCPPLLGLALARRPGCTDHNNKMVGALAESPPSTILIVASYFNQRGRTSEWPDESWRALERSVSTLRKFGHDVVLLGGWPPHPGGDLPHVLAREIRRGHHAEDYVFAIDTQRAGNIDRSLKGIAERQGATYIPLLEAVCGDLKKCRAYPHGQSIYFDSGHISGSTARHIVQNVILPALKMDAVTGKRGRAP